MTEPVAYINEYLDHSTNITRYKTENQRLLSSTPLYTSGQLHPRVKMTQAEFDEFKSLKSLSTSVFTAINLITKTENYKHLKVSSGITNGFNDIDWQNDFVYLFINFTFSNPEETIEIVPNMKWFVRSKESDINGYGWLSIIDKYQTPVYQYNNDKPLSSFVSFDTKEEAEKWTNPLTEVVLLPIDE